MRWSPCGSNPNLALSPALTLALILSLSLSLSLRKPFHHQVSVLFESQEFQHMAEVDARSDVHMLLKAISSSCCGC